MHIILAFVSRFDIVVLEILAIMDDGAQARRFWVRKSEEAQWRR